MAYNGMCEEDPDGAPLLANRSDRNMMIAKLEENDVEGDVPVEEEI
jgi:hypothetical protein